MKDDKILLWVCSTKGNKESGMLVNSLLYKFNYASYLIAFVYLFEEAAHVLTGGLQRDRGVGLMT